MSRLQIFRFFAALPLIAWCVCCRPVLAADSTSIDLNGDPAFLTIGMGRSVEFISSHEETNVFSAEYRAGPRLEFFFIRPSLGFFVTTDKSIYGYIGLSGDIFFGRRIVLTPQAAVGGYDKGNGRDLDGVLQFKTGAVLAWRFGNRARIGAGFHHISNANLYDYNPGIDFLSAFYSHPITF